MRLAFNQNDTPPMISFSSHFRRYKDVQGPRLQFSRKMGCLNLKPYGPMELFPTCHTNFLQTIPGFSPESPRFSPQNAMAPSRGRQLLISVFAPEGWPQSVAPEYGRYQLWDTIQQADHLGSPGVTWNHDEVLDKSNQRHPRAMMNILS